MNGSVPNTHVVLAEAEAQAVQDFLRRHMNDEFMTSSKIEDLIRKGGLLIRLDLQYLTEENFVI